MADSVRRMGLRAPIRYAQSYFSRELEASDLKRSAIIFAPHQDDETLGCGGTIIKKTRARGEVSLVFMTDGSGSHRHLIAEEELRVMRAREALAAGQTLGVAANRFFFLDFKDGQLERHQNAAVPRVVEILRRQQPDEVFIPCRKDPLPDHVATHHVVLSALKQGWQRAVIIYEYPIWLWRHWPWTSEPMRSSRGALGALRKRLEASWLLLNEFRYAVYTGDVLELKRAALNQYQSQMTRLLPSTDWHTLGDVSNGEFLECFFQDYEIFRRYDWPGRNQGRSNGNQSD